MTERERVAAQRAGFRLGFAAAGGDADAAERLAKYYYEYPKVTRQRVVRLTGWHGHALFLSVRDGELCYSYQFEGPKWHVVKEQNVGKNDSLRDDFNTILAHAADLLANPTAEVEDDG